MKIKLSGIVINRLITGAKYSDMFKTSTHKYKSAFAKRSPVAEYDKKVFIKDGRSGRFFP